MNDRKLNGDDISLLNEYIISADPDLARLGREKLRQYMQLPDAFADSIAKDWAFRIYRRISRPCEARPQHS